MIPESGSVSPSGREDWVSGSGRAQRPGAQSPRSRLCWEADAVRVGTPRPSLSSGRWQLRHREPVGIREKVRGAAAPLGPSCWWTASCPAHTACPAQAPVWRFQHASRRAWPPGREGLAPGCQLSDGLPGWPQTPHKTSPSVQGTGDPSSGSQWVLETRARWGSFIFSFGAVALIEVGGVFLRQSFLEPKFLRSEN